MKTSTIILTLWIVITTTLFIATELRISNLEDKLDQHLSEAEPTTMSEYIAELKAERDYWKKETERYSEWLVSCERYVEELEEF